MGITFDSFVDWSGFQPGPMFPAARSTFDTRSLWAAPIANNVASSLVPAVPSVLDQPNVEEWKQEISQIEWKSLGSIWITMAQQILANDPVFAAFQGPWYVTADGSWTDQFRKHPTFDVLREQLIIRMQEEFEAYANLVASVYRGAPPALAADSTGSDDLPSHGPAFMSLGWGWLKTIYKVGRIETLFSPEGVGWIIAEHALTYGIHRYESWQQQQEKERQRQERRDRYRAGRKNAHQLSLSVELPSGSWATTLDQGIKGFAAPGPSIGFFGVQGPSAQYKWTSLTGSPAALSSQDGIYL